MSRVGAAIVAAALIVSGISGSVEARGYNNRAAQAAARQRTINMLQQQLAAAKQTLSVAQAEISQAQGQIDESKSRVEAAKSSIESAKSEERSSGQSLDQMEAALIEKAGPDSEIGKTHAELQTAIAELAAAKQNVLSSESYKSQAAALDQFERPKLLPEIQKEALANDTAYQRAYARRKIAKVNWDRVRTQMVQSSEEWMAASRAKREAQSANNKAEGEAKAGAMARLPAGNRMREAKAVQADALDVIATCEMQLRALGVNPNPPVKTTASARK